MTKEVVVPRKVIKTVEDYKNMFRYTVENTWPAITVVNNFNDNTFVTKSTGYVTNAHNNYISIGEGHFSFGDLVGPDNYYFKDFI